MKSVCFFVQNVYDIDPRVRRKAEALWLRDIQLTSWPCVP